jgi:hypothetical protein
MITRLELDDDSIAAVRAPAARPTDRPTDRPTEAQRWRATGLPKDTI